MGLKSGGWTGTILSSRSIFSSATMGFSSSMVGVLASTLGGVINIDISTPTAGGRPRGNRRVREALARFWTRQSDIRQLVSRVFFGVCMAIYRWACLNGFWLEAWLLGCSTFVSFHEYHGNYMSDVRIWSLKVEPSGCRWLFNDKLES